MDNNSNDHDLVAAIIHKLAVYDAKGRHLPPFVVEDIAQSAVEAALTKDIHRFDAQRGSLHAFLKTRARWTTSGVLREELRRRDRAIELARSGVGVPAALDHVSLWRRARDEAQIEALLVVLGALPDDDVALVVERYVAGDKLAAIAERMCTSIASISRRLKAIRQRLQKMLITSFGHLFDDAIEEPVA